MTREPAAEPEPAAAGTDEDPDKGERDDKGQFKPRHRAVSQKAKAEDVPRINELTRRLRETEAERDALKARPAATAEPSARAAEPAPAPAPVPASAPFPAFDVWLAIAGNEAKSFEDFIDARSDFRYDQRRAAEKAEERAVSAHKAHQETLRKYDEQIPAAVKEYPDFHEVIASAPRTSKVIEVASIQVGPRVQYYLATHPDELSALTEESLVDPDNPAFPAAVASMRRYLSTLVASQRSSAPVAASTGSALALAPPVPRPPNPVRTGALHAADEPPGDDASLADHEKAFGPKRRRA